MDLDTSSKNNQDEIISPNMRVENHEKNYDDFVSEYYGSDYHLDIGQFHSLYKSTNPEFMAPEDLGSDIDVITDVADHIENEPFLDEDLNLSSVDDDATEHSQEPTEEGGDESDDSGPDLFDGSIRLME